MDWNLVAAYGLGLLLVYVLARLLFLPAKWLVRILYQAALGAIALVLINAAGTALAWLGVPGLHLPVNPVTAAAVGLLGIPGLALVAALRILWG